MWQNNRSLRYVVANRDDGYFQVNVVSKSNSKRRTSVEHLEVCQNCLDRLRYEGFSSELLSKERRARVARFTLRSFFERFPKSLLVLRPTYGASDAPLNDYPSDWVNIAERYKEEKSYTCERCGLQPDRRFVHVHHKNGQKNDCQEDNLKCLCLKCHAEEPMHSQIKASPGFREFCARYG